MSEAATVTDEQEQPRRCSSPGCGVGRELLMRGTDGAWWCFGHNPATRTQHKAASALGGIRDAARRRKGLDEDELGKLETPEDAKRMTATVALAVATGRLSSSQGRTVLVAITAWLRAHELEMVEDDDDDE